MHCCRLQIDRKRHMNVLLYHGKQRDTVTSPSTLAAYSVVITSYTMLANECGSISTQKGSAELIDLASDDECGALPTRALAVIEGGVSYACFELVVAPRVRLCAF